MKNFLNRIYKLNSTSEKLLILILVFVGVSTHLIWFNFNTILTSTDWLYWPDESVKQLYYSWGTWLSSWQLGYANIQIPFYPFMLAWSILVNLGLSFDSAAKITFHIPIALLGFISPYLLIRLLTKNPFAAFISAIFYGSTTYFLVVQMAPLPIAFVNSIAPLILCALINAFEKNKILNWLVFSLLFCLGIYYEVRIMYGITLALIIYVLIFYSKTLRKYTKGILYSFLIIFLLNLFWILPVFIGNIFYDIHALMDRPIFGENLVNINNAIALSHWSWNGFTAINAFDTQPIKIHLWLIALVTIFIIITVNKKANLKIFYFMFILILGIFLVKQSSPPFQNFYKYIFEYLPGFSLFRESSKFYLLISLGYLGLIGIGLNKIKKKYKTVLFLSFIVLLVAIINLYPLLFGKADTLFVSRIIPDNYVNFSNNIQNDTNFYRTLWIPHTSRWGYFANEHPSLGYDNALNTNWKSILSNSKEYGNEFAFLNLQQMNYLLDTNSIKYVIVPKFEQTYDGALFNNNERNKLIYILELTDFLKLRNDLSDTDLTIFENEGYKPHIYLTNEKETIKKNIDFRPVEHKNINPTKYEVNLKNISKPFYLNFSESFHPDWSIRVGDFSWFESLYKKKYFISNENHLKNDAGLNSFYVDPKVICVENNIPRAKRSGLHTIDNICKRNLDGSYDMVLTLYFKPQSWFYLGLIISVGTLIIVLSYLVYERGKWLYEKKNKKIN